jgi:aspartate racemase
MTTSATPTTGGLAPAPPDGPPQRVIGMLGGMSWESTAEYYRLANEGVRNRLGGLHSARIVLASVDFAEIGALKVAGDWDRAGEILAAEAGRLEAAGAELLLLCTNTHAQGRRPGAGRRRHPTAARGRHHRRRGAHCRAVHRELLATEFTMEQDFYRDRLAGHGVRVLVPGAADDRRLLYEPWGPSRPRPPL